MVLRRLGCVDHLKLDRGELAEGALAPTAVLLGLDPDHDRQTELLACLPALGVQDVLLQQGEGASWPPDEDRHAAEGRSLFGSCESLGR